jgi:hypothetical protein
MPAKPWIAFVSVALALSGCDVSERSPAAPETPEPVATAIEPTPAATVPTPLPGRKEAFSVTPQATPCGAEKLQNYLNLLPTSTAKDEIARSLGHNRVRYVPLQQAKSEPPSPGSTRVTAAIGVDGRIKEFACG